MYKKITHHITEEHFDHPMAAAVKKAIETKKVVNPKDFYAIDGQMSAGLDQFEKDNIHAWSGLAWVIGDLVNSIVDGTGDQAELLSHFTTIVDKISKLIRPIATDEQVTQFNSLLTAYGQATLAVVVDEMTNKDTVSDIATLNSAVAELSKFLNSLSTVWDATALASILTGIASAYADKAAARMKKDWAGVSTAGERAYKIIVVGRDNDKPSLADIFAHGIVSYNK